MVSVSQSAVWKSPVYFHGLMLGPEKVGFGCMGPKKKDIWLFLFATSSEMLFQTVSAQELDL